jgi:hypothetical protein
MSIEMDANFIEMNQQSLGGATFQKKISPGLSILASGIQF